MDPKDKILVALDVDTIDKAAKLASELKGLVGGVKVGLELITSCGAPQVVSALKSQRIFFDGKFKDIPNTVAGAARAVSRLGVWMYNVHALGGKKMMEEALKGSEAGAKESGVKRPLNIAVTILTSFDVVALKAIGLNADSDEDIAEHVVRLALLAKSSGMDGVVASPKEIEAIRFACGKDFLIVTPGVRPSWASVGDQKRVMTPKEAVQKGADYLVIGRPITNPPAEIGSPAMAVKKILEELR